MSKIITIILRGTDGKQYPKHINTRYIVAISEPYQCKHHNNQFGVCMELATQDQAQYYSYHKTEKEAQELIDYIVNECNAKD